MRNFTQSELVQMAQAERDMDRDSFAYLFTEAAKMSIHTQVMQRLKLVSGQTVSHFLMLEILAKNLAFCEKEAGIDNAASNRRTGLKTAFELSDQETIRLARLEREIDAGKHDFVRLNGDRVRVQSHVMTAFGLEQGQTVSHLLYNAIQQVHDVAMAKANRSRH